MNSLLAFKNKQLISGITQQHINICAYNEHITNFITSACKLQIFYTTALNPGQPRTSSMKEHSSIWDLHSKYCHLAEVRAPIKVDEQILSLSHTHKHVRAHAHHITEYTTQNTAQWDGFLDLLPSAGISLKKKKARTHTHTMYVYTTHPTITQNGYKVMNETLTHKTYRPA
jgi:hypothetical protein